ncbi:MAG TPA: biopolymer transporter ExbD [Myxococcota bacterium]|nr:biopolymer transporter ExbD [Myxococcota bacterium]
MRIAADGGAGEGDEMTLNLTSLIDVVFLLLIFFMVATTFLDPEREIGIELPEASSAELRAESPDEIVINVSREGRLTVGGRVVDRAGLEAELLRAARSDPHTPVTIRGDRLAHHEEIVGVMDACGSAGLSNLAVGTLETGG